MSDVPTPKYDPAVKEMVLPSGKFAMIRPLTGQDYLTAVDLCQDKRINMTFCFMALAVRIDDQPLKYSDILTMDLRDVMALNAQITQYVTGPVKA